MPHMCVTGSQQLCSEHSAFDTGGGRRSPEIQIRLFHVHGPFLLTLLCDAYLVLFRHEPIAIFRPHKLNLFGLCPLAMKTTVAVSLV